MKSNTTHLKQFTQQITNLYYVSLIPLSLFDYNGGLLLSLPFDNCNIRFQISNKFFENFSDKKNNQPHFCFDDNQIGYSIVPIQHMQKQYYILVGPTLTARYFNLSQYHLHTEMFKGLPIQTLETYSSLFPRVNIHDVALLCQLLFSLYCDRPINYQDLFLGGEPQDRSIANFLFQRREEKTFYNTYDAEQMICNIIRNGRVDKLDEIVFLSSQGMPGTISKDPLRNEKDLAIIYITLIARPAIEGGLSNEEAFSISDAYMKAVEDTNSASVARALVIRAVAEYTHRIAALHCSNSRRRLSENCMNYIHKNLHEKMTTISIAKVLGTNCKYLSKQFKESYNMSIAECISQERIKEAAHLLMTTDLPLAQISELVGFNSQSYFVVQFKKFYGKTPMEFIKDNMKNEKDNTSTAISNYQTVEERKRRM